MGADPLAARSGKILMSAEEPHNSLKACSPTFDIDEVRQGGPRFVAGKVQSEVIRHVADQASCFFG